MKRWLHYALIFLGVGAVVVATRVLDVRWRASTVRNASTTLKTLSSTDEGFRANDRDWSHVTAADPTFQPPGSLGEFVQGTRFWVDHWRTADCPHPATERVQGSCDAGLRMFWSKGLD
jgi:hypothetical protein